jgi:thiol:disulfide interchange protein DsbA
MQRRDFSLKLGSLAAGSLVLQPSLSSAQPGAPVAGVDYTRLGQAAPVAAPAGKIEVLEFFWYNCGHCNAFEPVLEAWVKKLPGDVAFRRVPAAWAPNMEPQQRFYFALEALGLVDKLHTRAFTAIHQEHQDLRTDEAIINWVVKQGVDKAKFVAQMQSFSASTKTRQAKQLADAYQIEGVPALGVAGRYFTDGTLSKSMDRALLVVDFLLAQIRRGG